MPDKQSIVQALLDTYKTSFAEDAGIELTNELIPLFQLFCIALICSTLISYVLAGKKLEV